MVRCGQRTVLALGRGRQIRRLTRCLHREEGRQVCTARHAGGRVEYAHLIGGAGHVAAVHASGGDARDISGAGADAVHKDPEAGESFGGLEDTVGDEISISCVVIVPTTQRYQGCRQEKAEGGGKDRYSPIEYQSRG